MTVTSVNNYDPGSIPNDVIDRKNVEEQRNQSEEKAVFGNENKQPVNDVYEKAVVVQDTDGIVTRIGATDSEKNAVNRATEDIFGKEKDDINLSGKTQIEIKRLYESGQISETDYELEMQKRGLDKKEPVEDTGKEEDEESSKNKALDTAKQNEEARQKQIDQMKDFENSLRSKESFEDTMDKAKELIRESGRFQHLNF